MIAKCRLAIANCQLPIVGYLETCADSNKFWDKPEKKTKGLTQNSKLAIGNRQSAIFRRVASMGINGPENRAGIKSPGVRFLYPLPFGEVA